ncbi:MAG: hypothetical protein PVG39_10385 [Desulfobacteraceae bacterium]|jgi:hypothetical protein
MKTGNIRRLLILVMLIVLISTFACSAGRDVYEVSSLAADSISNMIFPDNKPVLKKKILVTPVINKTGFSASQAEEIRQDCISYLSKDKYLIITSLKKWGDNDASSFLEQYGTVLNQAYAKAAEEMGMNILLACIIHPIEVTKKRTGVWPLRKDSYNVMISISINALDAVNGTLIVYNEKTENINFDVTDSGESNNWTPDYNMLRSEISSMTKKLCSSFVDRLRRQYWQSKVTVDSDNLVINAGKAIGINENTVFEVFKKGDRIDTLADGEYYIFGEKIGETRPRSISENKTVLAANINGELEDAAFVRVKRHND